MSDRPLSPHLQVYKVQITSFFSIMHRFTGILLFLLLIVFSWYFVLHVYFPESLIVKYLNMLLLTPVAKLVYISSFVSFTYHLLNGIRHLLWDMGFNLEIEGVTKSALLITVVLFFSTMVFLFMFL